MNRVSNPSSMPARKERRTNRAGDPGLVLSTLEHLCDSLRPGDLIPTHTELMRRYDASERSVRWALEELRRRGRVVRRVGSGTYVAEPRVDLPQLSQDPAQIEIGRRTIVAITTPDQSVYDYAMTLLFRCAESAGLELVGRMFDPAFADAMEVPPNLGRPLGIILFRRHLIPLALRLQELGHRVVVIGTPAVDESPMVPTVHANQEHGGYMVAKHLIDLGHRRIALTGNEQANFSQRWQGLERAVRESARRGVTVSIGLLAQPEIEGWRGNPGAIQAYFSRPDAPTGIAAWNDHEAVLLLSQLMYAGIRVPDDVSLVGYDNLPEGQRLEPSLTSVDTGLEAQLHAALRLIDQTSPLIPGQMMVLLPSLIQRASSRSVTS